MCAMLVLRPFLGGTVMPFMYLTHPREWTVYDLWTDANTENAIIVDVPEALIARWQTVKNEFSAVQRVLHDLYHDALSQQKCNER
jgi:hypothetical protein